jgi:AcrR family transcriptional regulator
MEEGKMARRYDHSRHEIKEMAIESGKKIIILEGFKALSTRRIADKIGYTAGTLYNVFDNFDDIAFHIHAQTIKDAYTFIADKCAGKTGPDAVRIYMSNYRNFVNQNRNLFDAIFEHFLPEGEKPPTFYTTEFKKLIGLLYDIILPLFDYDEEETEVTTTILWSSYYGTYLLSKQNRLELITDKSTAEVNDKFLEQFIEYLELKNLNK